MSDGKEILSEILDMGFEAVALSCHVTRAILDGMRPSLGKDVQVVSIQNFCPVPDILPEEMAGGDAFLLSSSDSDERQTAVDYTIRTLELADAIEAKIVVCHLGHVDIRDPTEKLAELYDKGKREADDFESLLQEAKDDREVKRQRNLDAALFSLDELNKRAEQLDINIGIENRREFRQIPSLNEIGIILGEFDGANIAYWHSVGHVQIQNNLGIADHRDLLEEYSDKMIGIHLSDVKSTTDGMVPGTGDLDFRMVNEYLSPDTVKVMQLTTEPTREETIEGLSHLEESGIA